MGEHTPGPWVAQEMYVNALRDHATTAVAYAYPEEPEWKANARLIAAAPDLLAALEALLDNGDDPHPLSGRDPTVRREDIGPARAAIARAKGSEVPAP